DCLFDLPIGEDENDPGKSQTHQGLIDTVFGHIEAAPIFTFSSGRPVDALTGTDEERSRAYPFAARPVGFGRNTLQTPRFVNVDLRVVKFIPYGGGGGVDFTVGGFNLLNQPNKLAGNTYLGPGRAPIARFGKHTDLPG